MIFNSFEQDNLDLSLSDTGNEQHGLTTDDEMIDWKSHNDTCSAMVKVVTIKL